MKRTLSLVLVLTMLLSLFSGVAFAEADKGEKTVFTVAVGANALIDDYQNNYFTKYLEETFNVELKMEVWSEPKTKLSMLVGANAELPDIICFQLDDATTYKYGASGAFLDLTEYYENPELAPYYQNLTNIYPGRNYKQLVDEGATSPDGKKYNIPLVGMYFPNEVKFGLWVNQEWLKAVEMEAPTTPEQFKEMLIAFRDKDPNGNGKADEIPMMGNTAWASNPAAVILSFFCDANPDYKYFSVKDGTIYPQFMTEEFKTGLKYLRSLVEEGLLDPASFTQNDAQLKSIINTEDDTAVVGVLQTYCGSATKFNAPTPIPTGWRQENDHPVGKQYRLIKYPTAVEGLNSAIYTKPNGIPMWFITKDCENPELAFKIGDLGFDPYTQLSSRHGWEGVNWTSDPEELKGIYAATIGGERLETKWYVTQDPDPITQHYTWRQQFPGVFAYEFNLYRGWVVDPTKETCMSMNFDLWYDEFYDAEGNLKVEAIGQLKYTEDETEELTLIKNAVDTYVAECITAFATGNMDIDRDWEGFLEELKGMEVDRYTEIMQDSYDRANK